MLWGEGAAPFGPAGVGRAGFPPPRWPLPLAFSSLPYGPRPNRTANIHITVRRDLPAPERSSGGGGGGGGGRSQDASRRNWFKITVSAGQEEWEQRGVGGGSRPSATLFWGGLQLL